jgi:hypothetical protein
VPRDLAWRSGCETDGSRDSWQHQRVMLAILVDNSSQLPIPASSRRGIHSIDRFDYAIDSDGAPLDKGMGDTLV